MPDPLKDVETIAELARSAGLTVGAAESLTGGAVSSALARGSGAADWYRGCLVSYGEQVKHDVLGVSPGPLVSERCAVEMVRGIADLLGVGAAVSTTGAGGPGSEEGQPAGTVYVGIWLRGEVTCHRLALEGDPGEVVDAATEQALELLVGALRGAADS